ncbi:MAG: MmcQ/YjbR family DNA-binding protein [Chloroflexi bacterium]|nr:MAG: MmcQ/YjbR family DNA-binding protein [Chloroflexota bacterium]
MAATFEQVRAIALGFPGVEERASFEGRPAFRTKKRGIIYSRPEPDVIVLWMPIEARDVLCVEQPKVFFFTDHYRDWPSVLVRLKVVKRAVLEELIEDAWRAAATKTQIAEWEASR